MSTDGDPQEAWKWQKSGSKSTKKSVTTALTKKSKPSKTTTGTSKAVPTALNRASAKVPGKNTHLSDDSDDSDDLTSNQTNPLLRLQMIKAIIDSHSFKSLKSDEPRKVQVLDLYYLTRFESESSSREIVLLKTSWRIVYKTVHYIYYTNVAML